MWSPLIFCLIVGLALGSNTSAWKDNKEYIYKIQGRALAGLEIANEFSGILLKASLRIQTRPDGKLQCLIVKPQYAQIHSELSDGWMTYIPNHEVSWKPLEMSRKPFQVEITRGVITDLIISQGVSNWEANMIKGIMSQFQMNLSEVDSSRKDDRQDSASYRVYEQTVSGNTDTVYEINPVPEYMLLNSEVPKLQKFENDDDQILEVRKHKNYIDSIELPSYFYGFGNVYEEQAATNVMGRFFLRNTLTRALITGNLKQFTIQHCLTINEIYVHPTIGDKQRGAVYTSWNSTLQEVKSQEQILEDLAAPVRLGGLVYAYDKPFAQSNAAHARNSNKNQIQYNKPALHKLNPSLFSEYEASEYKQDKPQINKAPESPFFPFTVGNKGLSIKSEIDVVKTSVKLAREIAQELQDPRKLLKENTMEKYIILTALLRTMDESELRQVSKKLYTTNEDRTEYAAWAIFRDCVSESGHGPALLMIQSWIELKYIKHEEASHVISTMANTVHHPTTQYMKTFFELIKKPVVAADWPLNETSILSFSDLVHNLYYNENYFNTQFPVNTFENLKDKEGLRFVRDTVIPYFTQRLDKAILQADTNKIHAYIRALGYIGTPEILRAYKPYLEGTKHCSQYQRALMIVSLERLVVSFPKAALPVLLRTYQNIGESSEVRVAAVFQLMHATPELEILQDMASYTKIDTDEQVNAAVKSSILTAANLEGGKFAKFRDNADMVKSLLTEKTYGIHQGGNYLKTYFIENLDRRYKQTVQIWSSNWKYIPNGLKYDVLKSKTHGIRDPIVNVQSLITSVKQLVDSLREQTKDFKKEEQQKRDSDESQKYPWSSQNIAKMLNMKSDVREQLEGSVFFTALNTPYKMLSFDNRTINRLPELIKKLEEKLSNGQKFDVVKILNGEHMSLAIPNEIGLPFIFTYNAPMYIKFDGKVNAASNPQISQNGKIVTPERLKVSLNASLTIGSKVSGRLSFITPFDSQEYLSGFDKFWQAHVPIVSNMEIDVKKNEVDIEIEPKEIHAGAQLYHYSSWPFTARRNIMDFNTITAEKHRKIIKPQQLRKFEGILGKKETGLAFKVESKHERNTIDISYVRAFCKYGIMDGLSNLRNDAQIQYSVFNIAYLPEESSTEKIVMRLGYQQKYNKQGEEKPLNWQEVSRADKLSARQQILIQGAASGIKSVKSYAIATSVAFQGQKNIEYTLSGAYSSSNVDAKSRVYAFYKKESQSDKPVEIKFESINDMPNPNSMDLQDILASAPKGQSQIKIKFDSRNGEGNVQADIRFARSEERKQYLTEQPTYHQCVRDVRVGNKQSPACVNMTVEANLLDKIDVDVKFENIDPRVQKLIEMVDGHLQYVFYPNLGVEERSSMPEKQMKLQARFDRDLNFVNVTVNTHEQEVTFRDIELNDYAKKILVVHPYFDVYSRVMSKVLEIDTFKSTCIVDRSQVTTFNNWTYPADISKQWTVVAQLVPKNKASVEQQLERQLWNSVILVRENQQTKERKDVKIVLSAPETKFKVFDITMLPNQQGSKSKAAVKVNDKAVQTKNTESYDIENGFVQIYEGPNGEVKVIVQDKFYVVYDGQRVKIGTMDGFLRDQTRGLCGQFNDQQRDDLLTSQNCFARNPQNLIRSYEVEGQEGKQIRQKLQEDSEECLEKEMPLYVNIVSEKDVAYFDQSEEQQDTDCTVHQTRYVEQNNEICFTTRVVPTCKRHCQAQGYITKSVPAHCFASNNVAQLWKQQINNGANPDFSHKSENRRLQMNVPQSCTL